jgi:monoamine oxidase
MSHIIIVGAGICGLYAGRFLSKNGYKITIVEARDRIGGRINTLHAPFAAPTEAGAEFIHGDLPLSISLVKEAELKTNIMSGNIHQIKNGSIHRDQYDDGDWDSMTAALQKLEHDMPIADFLMQQFPYEKHQSLHDSVLKFVEGYDAADTKLVSSFALRDEWSESDDDKQYRLPEGYGKAIHYLYQELITHQAEIHLAEPVKSVTWKSNSVFVTTEKGKVIEGDKILITVPISILQNNGIAFTPSLPVYTTAAKNIGYGGVIKFLFEFKEPIWETKNSRMLKNAKFIFSDAPIPTWWSQLPDKRSLLTGWLAGPKTLEKSFSQEELFNKAITSLAYITSLPEKIVEQEISAWHIADWVSDPHSQGAYAYATTRTIDARKTLMTPIENTVYFAGEALYAGPAMGTVEAALTTGQEVARKMMQ